MPRAVGIGIVLALIMTLVPAEPASSGAGQIASVGCSQWVHAIGDADTIGWEDSNDDFTLTAGQGGGHVLEWVDTNSSYWVQNDSVNDGNEVAVAWMLCIKSGSAVTEDSIQSVYDNIRDRWPVQPIYVMPLDVGTPPCGQSGLDQSLELRDWALDNLGGTFAGPVLSPPLSSEETLGGCHPNQVGVDRWTALLETWVPVMLEGGVIVSGRFYDDDGSPHEGYIEAIAEAGITQGCDAQNIYLYCPEDPVTRAQMATFIDRAFGLPDATQDYFIDDDGLVHEDAINRVAEAGISLGCPSPTGNTFCPNDPVTRAQMASFIDRAIPLAAASQDYFDDDDDLVHEDAINRIAEDGITLGCWAGNPRLFCPNDTVTRAQMASFLGRALDLEEIFP